MCAAALQQIQLNAAHLCAGLLLQYLRQNCGQAAQLCMAEAVIGGYLCLGYKAAVLVMNTFRHGNNAAAFFSINALHIFDKSGHTKVNFRQVDQIRTCTVLIG